MVIMFARPWLVLVLLAVSAPAAAQDVGVSWNAGRRCTSEQHRQSRRDRVQVRRDSIWDHLVREIRDDLVRSAGQAGVAAEGLVLVEYNVRERTGRMWMPQGAIPTATLEQVYARAQPLLAAYPHYGRLRRAQFHVRLEPSVQDSLRIGDLVTRCSPEILNETEIREMTLDFARNHPHERSGRAHVTAVIARDGRVVYTELTRSSGSQATDQFAQQMFARMRFLPALVNGEAVDLWVEQPVEVRVR